MPNQSEKDASVNTIEITAKTVDEAIDQGLAQLAATREQVNIEIVKEGKRGVFGLGSEDALVRLTLHPHPEEPVAVVEQPAQTPDASPAPQTEDVSPHEVNKAEPTPTEPDVTKIAIGYLQGLLERMGIEATVTARVADDLVEPGEDPPLVLDVTGSDLGILIGRRSETLRALQYMIRLMVSKQMSRWQPLVVDVESYRVRRRNSLYQLAEKMAEQAVSSQRKVVMESMPAYERRIIHIALRDHPEVITKSVGSDDNRKVTIVPK